jgi:hypothetical protein
MLFTVDSAKAFLLAKIRDQATRDQVQFDEVERGMFQFSEASRTPDMEAAEKFDAAYDAKTYEAKVTKLLRKAYAHDQRNAERKKEWKQALEALSEEDFYGLVMVDNAGIPRVDASLWKFEPQQLPFLLTELAVIGIGRFVVIQPHGFLSRLPD